MFHIFDCNVRVRFDDADVVRWLVDEDDLDEEEAKEYKPTYFDMQRYAWYLIAMDVGEYDSPMESQ